MDLLQAARAEAGAGSAARARAARAGMTGHRADAATVADLLDELRGLAQEQAALRRVATLVAQGAEPRAVFMAAATEAARLLRVEAVSLIRWDPQARLMTKIYGTHGQRAAVPDGGQWTLDDGPECALIVATLSPVRIDDWTVLPGPVVARHVASGFGQCVAAPLILDGELWGMISAFGEAGQVLPPGSEARLADFTQLMATAIANAQARDELRAAAERQAALLRVATLVAQGTETRELFRAIATQASQLLGIANISLLRYDAQARTVTEISGIHHNASALAGATLRLEDAPLGSLVIGTGQPARVDDWTGQPGPAAAAHRAEGVGAAVGAPIIVDGTIWGYLGARVMTGEALPRDSESQLAEFTRLMAMAIANAQSRDTLRDLAEEQAALRRVATLVAEGADPGAVFAAVVTEATRVLRVGQASLLRWDPGARLATKVYGTHAEPIARSNGTVWAPRQGSLSDVVLRAGRPLWIDNWKAATREAGQREVTGDGFTQCISAPITVDGEQWGVLVAFGESTSDLPPGAETRLATFAQLMATAIADAQVRADLRALAEQQGAALRRVATLVAQQAPPAVIFGAVAREASHALRVPRVDVVRCNPDGSVTPLGTAAADAAPSEAGPLSGTRHLAGLVVATGRATRADTAMTSGAAAPITVDGSTWGVIIVHADAPLPGDTETRLTDFTHLVASSISTVVARDKLVVSRARIVSASDETRRRIERNIHDGVQQRILGIALALRAARARAPLPPDAEAGLDEVAGDLEAVLEEIRAFSRGLHPALLSRAGLGPALRDLARRSPIPVEVDAAGIRRLPQPVESAVYYVVCEALANAAKYSRADEVTVTVTADREAVRARVRDDGAGGASPGHGTGLIGLIDRVEALGGRLALDSPPGQGTTISVDLPLAPQAIDGQPGR